VNLKEFEKLSKRVPKSKKKFVWLITFEYSYSNNLLGAQSPDEAGGVLELLYEDYRDAQKAMTAQKHSGDWGDFSKAANNDGWSDQGFILALGKREIIPRKKRAA